MLLVNDVTRNSSSSSSSVLDLVLCSDNFAVNNVTVVAPFSTSDHCAVDFNLCCFSSLSQSSHGQNSFDRYNFNLADWSVINDHLRNVDWPEVFSQCETADQFSNAFYNVIYDCFHHYIPIQITWSNRPRGFRYPAYVNKIKNKKFAVWKLYSKFRTPELHIKFKQLCSQYREAVCQAISSFETAIVKNGNLGKFYRYANSKFSTKSNVGSLLKPDGELTCDAKIKAELLCEYFKGVFTADNGVLPNVNSSHAHCSLENIVFTPTMVKRSLSKLKAKAAGGPDLVPPIFLKRCSSALCQPLAVLFQIFFDNSYLPPVWLQAFITPVFKKGNPALSSNYRPISLTCTLCKLMEVIVKDQLLSYLLNKGLITKDQHGFMSRHSTVTNLLECTHDWYVSFQNRIPVDVIYIDFSRAFDSVVHSKLIHKLSSFGICGKLLMWIKAFLSNRSQCVLVENHNSI